MQYLNKVSRLMLVAALAVGLLFAMSAPGQASMVTYTVPATAEISGSGAVMPGPAVATFDDGGSAGSVTLTMDLSGWVGGVGAATAYVAEWFFQTAVDLSSAVFVISGPVGTTSIDLSPGTFDGAGTIFDWSVVFPSAAAGRFTTNEVVTVDITLAGLTANDFAAGPNDLYGSGVRARALGDGSGSGWFVPRDGVIPEPGSILVWSVMSLLGLMGYVKVTRTAKS